MRQHISKYKTIEPEGFELFVLVIAVLGGLPLVFGDAKPGSIESALPAWQADVWGWMLAGGSLIALIGCLWRRREIGLLVEQVGMAMIAVACGYYAVVIIFAAGLTAVTPTLIVLAFATACGRRWFRIQNFITDAEAEVSGWQVDDGQ